MSHNHNQRTTTKMAVRIVSSKVVKQNWLLEKSHINNNNTLLEFFYPIKIFGYVAKLLISDLSIEAMNYCCSCSICHVRHKENVEKRRRMLCIIKIKLCYC